MSTPLTLSYEVSEPEDKLGVNLTLLLTITAFKQVPRCSMLNCCASRSGLGVCECDSVVGDGPCVRFGRGYFSLQSASVNHRLTITYAMNLLALVKPCEPFEAR